MLMLTGVVVEIVDGKPRHMLLFSSPRVPGTHYQVHTDQDTANNMRVLIATETKAVALFEHVAQGNSDNDGDEEQPDSGKLGR